MNQINLFKQFIYGLIVYLRPSLLFKIQHYRIHRKYINKSSFTNNKPYIANLNSPKTFNEFILKRKNNVSMSSYFKYVDKYLVKNHVRSVIGEKYLIPTQKYYPHNEKIDVEHLSFPIVLKPTHLSGYVLKLDKKSDFDTQYVNKLQRFMSKLNLYKQTGEIVYKNTQPGVIVEPMLDMNNEVADYKFFCFNGHPLFIQVDTDRFKNHRRTIYDLDWEKLDFEICYKSNPNTISKPKNFHVMKEIASDLSKGFKFIRIDLYNLDGKIFFGEMTFNPGSGHEPFSDYKYDLSYGQILNSE